MCLNSFKVTKKYTRSDTIIWQSKDYLFTFYYINVNKSGQILFGVGSIFCCFYYFKMTCIAAWLRLDAIVIPAGAEVIFNGKR